MKKQKNDNLKQLPRFVRIQQPVIGEQIEHIESEVCRQLEQVTLVPGERIAVAVGSRGIANIARIVKAAVKILLDKQAQVFIVPAMGSHGGGTAESQKQILHEYGLCESSLNVPIISSIETETISTQGEFSIHVDKAAWQADRILLINRIKPHTLFDGKIGSGIMKMMTVGLGNPVGASIYHAAARTVGMENVIYNAASVIMQSGKILGGLAILENSQHQTGMVRWMNAGSILQEEPQLYKTAHLWSPAIPFNELDGLIVDQIGKDISGTGMDTNVIGRRAVGGTIERIDKINIGIIYARDLSEKTAGNGNGIGLADIAHKRLVTNIDSEVTRINAFTAGNYANFRIPVTCASDKEALNLMMKLSQRHNRSALAWIRNTLEIEELFVTESLLESVQGDGGYEVSGDPFDLMFDQDGNLIRPD